MFMDEHRRIKARQNWRLLVRHAAMYTKNLNTKEKIKAISVFCCLSCDCACNCTDNNLDIDLVL
jgi:hypothetical protein